MPKTIAFLRGINVGWHAIIKMDELRSLVSATGFDNVATYKQSGNLLFETKRKPDECAKLIKNALSKKLNKDIEVFVLEQSYLKGIVASDPFRGIKLDPSHMFITLFVSKIPKMAKLPKRSPKGEIEILLTEDNAIFWTLDLKKGQYNADFVEKLFKIPSTTRNWRSISEIAALE